MNDSTREPMILRGDHNGSAKVCAFSPDGRRICSGDAWALRIWDAETGQNLRALRDPEISRVNDCAFSSDGSRIVSANSDGTLRLRDAESGEELQALFGHHWGMESCAFSPDGSWVCSTESWRLRLWDVERGAEAPALGRHSSRVYEEALHDCAFSPDGRRICCASRDRKLRLWDARSGELIRTLEGHTSSWVRACAFSPDGSRVASASDDRTVRLWDAESGEEVRALEGHTDMVWDCAFSPDGAWVASVSRDRTLRLWQARGTGFTSSALPSKGVSVALHPRAPIAACATDSGVYVTHLAGIEYGPIVVTAADRAEGPAIRCPVCLDLLELDEGWLGREITCPRAACDARLRVNPFVIEWQRRVGMLRAGAQGLYRRARWWYWRRA